MSENANVDTVVHAWPTNADEAYEFARKAKGEHAKRAAEKPYDEALLGSFEAWLKAKRPVTAPKSAGSPRTELKVRYYRNGKLLSERYKVGELAWFFSKGIDGDKPVSSKRFVELLAGLGVADPRGSEFDVVLPNGEHLSARFIDGAPESVPHEGGPVVEKKPRSSRDKSSDKAEAKAPVSKDDAKALFEKRTGRDKVAKVPAITEPLAKATTPKAPRSSKPKTDVTPIPKSAAKPRASRKAS